MGRGPNECAARRRLRRCCEYGNGKHHGQSQSECAARRRLRLVRREYLRADFRPGVQTSAPLDGDCDKGLALLAGLGSARPNEGAARRRLRQAVLAARIKTRMIEVRMSAPPDGDCDSAKSM